MLLSPTSEGSVCDIQLVTMAMVLSTAPILSSGTDIAPLASCPAPPPQKKQVFSPFCSALKLSLTHPSGVEVRGCPDGEMTGSKGAVAGV